MEPRINNEDEAMQFLADKFGKITEELLKDGVQHTEVWKRTIKELPPGKSRALYEKLRNSSLTDLLLNRMDPVLKKEWPQGEPTYAYVSAEEFDHTNYGRSRWTELELGFRYMHPHFEFEDLTLGVDTKRMTIGRKVISTEYMETGYEGHAFLSRELSVDEADLFHRVMSEAATPIGKDEYENLWRQDMEEMAMVDIETGQEYPYNPEKKGLGCTRESNKSIMGEYGGVSSTTI